MSTTITDDMVRQALRMWGFTNDYLYDEEMIDDMRKALAVDTNEEAINIWIPISPDEDDIKAMNDIRAVLRHTQTS